jgi:hypothetical protein
MRKTLYMLRRFILRNLVPEVLWPKYTVIDGIYIKIRHTPYSFGIKWLLSRNHEMYELAERSFIAALSEGDHVLEFGGSIGIVTALIADKIGKRGKIVSVEASENIVLYSKSWLEDFGNISVLQAYAFPIASAVPMQATFDGDGGSLGGIVSYEYMETEVRAKNEQHFFIEDAYDIAEFSPNVLFIDIEGSEQIMLEHKPNIPKAIEKIVIELHPGLYGSEINGKIIEVIEAEGFELEKTIETVYQFLRSGMERVV